MDKEIDDDILIKSIQKQIEGKTARKHFEKYFLEGRLPG